MADATTVEKGRKTSRTTAIPMTVQRPLMERLLFLRRARGINRHEITAVSSSTLQKVEQHDLSTLRLGDLYGLAIQYGMTLPEMLMYLASDEPNTEASRTEQGRRLQRMSVYLRNLPDDLQDLAINIVGEFVGYHADRSKLDRSLAIGNGVSGARQMVREALAKAER